MDYVRLLSLSAIVMCCSHTIARERIFAPLRRALGGDSKPTTWLGYLVSCPYCASHWVALAVLLATGDRFVVVRGPRILSWPGSLALSTFLVVAVAAAMRVAFYLVDEEGRLAREERKG